MAYSARLRADDRRPPRGALEPRDVDLDVDEPRRAHRPGQHARSAFSRRAVRAAGPHQSLQTANNYANSLCLLQRFEEARSLLRRTMPVARCVLGEEHRVTLKMRLNYAAALCEADGATLDDLREAANTLEDVAPVARRVFGGAHPLMKTVEEDLRKARAGLAATEQSINT